MKKEIVLSMIEELEIEKKKTQKVPHYYKRNGVMLERSYPDYIETERYKELLHELKTPQAKVFECACCKKMVGYFELEMWLYNPQEDEYVCAMCYEDEMGADL